jgi:hypothetical protein
MVLTRTQTFLSYPQGSEIIVFGCLEKQNSMIVSLSLGEPKFQQIDQQAKI